MFGLHGKGSLGSKEGDVEIGDEEEAMMAASLDGEQLEPESLRYLRFELETIELETIV